MSEEIKEIRTNLARAKGYFHRHDVQRALAATALALGTWVKSGAPRLYKNELYGALREMLGLLNRTDEVTTVLEKGLVWEPGQERGLLMQFAEVLRAIQELDMDDDHRRILARKQQLDKLFKHGCLLLADNKVQEADKAFQEAMLHYEDEDSIFRLMGQRMLDAGEPALALRYLKRAIKASPNRDVVEMAIDAYKRSGKHGAAIKLEQVHAALLKAGD